MFKKGIGDFKKSNFSFLRDRKFYDYKVIYDIKWLNEEIKFVDKNFCKDCEKYVLEVRNNKELSGNKLFYIFNLLEI